MAAMEAVAKLMNVPSSPRKMRLVADLIRGQKVNKALNILKFQSNYGAAKLEKLLLSAISNWQNKYQDIKIEEADLFIMEITVDGGRVLKRVRPAPQGRAYRVRKRSNHVKLVVASNIKPMEERLMGEPEKKEAEKKEPVKKKTVKKETPGKEVKKKQEPKKTKKNI